MGTIDEYYSVESTEYYNEDRNYVLEEFIFQIDFSDAEIFLNRINSCPNDVGLIV